MLSSVGEQQILGRISIATVALLLVLSSPVAAQMVAESVGTGGTQRIGRNVFRFFEHVKKVTRYVTLDTYGSRAIGPFITSWSAGVPDLVTPGDQTDAYFLLAGPDKAGDQELAGGGLGYRIPLAAVGTKLYFRGDAGRLSPGGEINRQLGATGNYLNLALGLRRKWQLAPSSSASGWLGFQVRHTYGRALGAKALDEDLRIVKAGLTYHSGTPFSLRTSAAVWLNVGLGGLGASPPDNPFSTIPGDTSRFFRVSAKVAASVPLPDRFWLNGSVTAQWTDQSLPFSQRCGYGTNAYSRGFDNSYVNGDRCVAVRNEIALDVHRPDPASGDSLFVQLYSGIDYGVDDDVGNAVLPATRTGWSDVSVGVRSIFRNVGAEATITQVIHMPDVQLQDPVYRQTPTRFWVRAALRF